MPVCRLRKLPGEYVELPCQAFRCQVQGMKPVERYWSLDALNAMRTRFHDILIWIRIVVSSCAGSECPASFPLQGLVLDKAVKVLVYGSKDRHKIWEFDIEKILYDVLPYISSMSFSS